MPFKHCTANYAFFPTYVERYAERDLQHWIVRQHDMDFGDYSDRGGGITYAHLRWSSETGQAPATRVTFEAVEMESVVIEDDLSPETVAARWIEFTDRVKSAVGLRTFQDRRDELRAQDRTRAYDEANGLKT